MNQVWQNFLKKYLKSNKTLLLINLFIKKSKNSKSKIQKSILPLFVLVRKISEAFEQRIFSIITTHFKRQNDLVLFVK
ncbi:MAG: hypothetical protein ACJA02_000575 [Myxococcota bacterium]|jgi:hypothetical protein